MVKSWDVVFWLTQRAVDYVPSSWANHDLSAYKWPTSKTLDGQQSIKDLITNCEGIKHSYKFYPALFKKRVLSIEDAETFTSRADKGSDLDSDQSEQYTLISKKTPVCNNLTPSDEEDTLTNSWVRERPDFSSLNDTVFLLKEASSVLTTQEDNLRSGDQLENRSTPTTSGTRSNTNEKNVYGTFHHFAKNILKQNGFQKVALKKKRLLEQALLTLFLHSEKRHLKNTSNAPPKKIIILSDVHIAPAIEKQSKEVHNDVYLESIVPGVPLREVAGYN
ncbi:hypothetical protein FQR65_LT15997 [Abscondita terminalis]|nr:hypothetical protein FQR65_LT15997 [Abscondita terminalis]